MKVIWQHAYAIKRRRWHAADKISQAASLPSIVGF